MWVPRMGTDALALDLAALFDAQQRVLILGARDAGASLIVRLLAARDTTHVRVHVQSASGSGGTYSAAGDEGALGVVDFRADKIQDVTVSDALASPIHLWAIPVRYEAGSEIRYDGVAAPDYMAHAIISHDLTSTSITDFEEAVEDVVAGLAAGTANQIVVTYTDPGTAVLAFALANPTTFPGSVTIPGEIIASGADQPMRRSSTAQRWLFCGGSAAALSSGALMQFTGATYTGVANTRGTIFLQGGQPSVPVGDDGAIILTTNNVRRLVLTSAGNLGFFNVTPVARAAALTQTYATADRTLAAYTADAESAAYTGAADGEAKLADLNALRVAYENLRAFTEDLAQFVNSLVDDMQAYGLEQ